jgi:DNA repair protein RecN (Recombination protein N)
MLTSLHVSNYILIDSLDISFPGGLIIITGQTGAGKSIIMGALSAVLGARTDASAVGPRGENCVIEATFSQVLGEPLLNFLKDNDIEPESDELVLRRVISRSGRSRCFADDCPVTVGFLQQLGEYLVDVHSQHQTLRLSDPSFKLSVLDTYAGNGQYLSECASAFRRLSEARAEAGRVRASIEKLEAEREYNDGQYRRLTEAALAPGELEELEAEQKRLANAEEIRETLFAASNALSPSGGDLPAVSSVLKEASRTLSRISGYIPSLEDTAGRLDSARIEIEDIVEEIEAESSSVEVSPGRLAEVEERLSLIYGLFNRYGVRDIDSLINLRDRFRDSVEGVEALSEKLSSLEKEVATLEKEAARISDSLHERRLAAAEPFAAEVLSSLRFLELDKATFKVVLGDAPAGPSGHDCVSFMFSASGVGAVEISKAASGGELSRIMLSIKNLMARYMNMPTLVFDEIDTGVSGSAADRMGSMICSMGEHMQVFAITHLPQVAAKGQAHYLVTKEENITAISRIEGDDRINEIARMLSGSSLTPQAIENARVLMGPSGS